MSERTVIVIHIPWVPDPRCSPNGGRCSERTRIRYRKKGAEVATYPVRGERGRFDGDGPLFDGPVTLDLDVKWPKGRKQWDADNLIGSYKYTIDVLQREGIVSNDRNIRIGEIRQMQTDGQEETVLTISEVTV